jgi:hypothetical protein
MNTCKNIGGGAESPPHRGEVPGKGSFARKIDKKVGCLSKKDSYAATEFSRWFAVGYNATGFRAGTSDACGSMRR